jgi:hypothetical protein
MGQALSFVRTLGHKPSPDGVNLHGKCPRCSRTNARSERGNFGTGIAVPYGSMCRPGRRCLQIDDCPLDTFPNGLAFKIAAIEHQIGALHKPQSFVSAFEARKWWVDVIEFLLIASNPECRSR